MTSKQLSPLLLFALLAACATPTPAPTTTPRCPIAIPPTACPATQLTLAAPSGPVKTFGRLELVITTDGIWANPFDPAQVDLQVRFTSPSGQAWQVPAFWYQDFDPATQQPTGAAGWRVRFTPTHTGAWQAQAMLAQGHLSSALVSFQVSADPSARGFVQINPANHRYFGFADGSTFLPIGLNIAWADSLTQTVPEYSRWLASLSQNGGNLARVWMADWSVGIEWNDTGLGDYTRRQQRAWLLDQVFNLADQNNVYILLSLINHGAFSQSVNPEWNANPYNLANGGVITSPVDFATSPAAKAIFQRRVRYIAARWGYSTHLFAWEWWNEVNFTGIPDDTLQPWIVEMTHFLQQFDPYGHLVTSSYSEGRRSLVWKVPELSFMQQHDYTGRDPALEFADVLAAFGRASRDKPLLVGEHGLPALGEPPAPTLIAATVHFHNGLWAGPFTGLAGSALAWNWNDLVDPNGLWSQYKPLADFFEGENLAPMKPITDTLADSAAPGPARAIALSLQSQTRALVWVRSQPYEASGAILAYEKAVGAGTAGPSWAFQPPTLSGLSLAVHNLPDGAYTARWFDPQSSQWLAQTNVESSNGLLSVAVPDFSRDLALKLIKN